MPLPDAKPNPDKANVYDQLSNIKLGELTLTQFNVLRDPLFLNGQSEDVLRRLKLIYEISKFYPTGAPFVNTQKIVTASSTGTSATVFRPDQGEVWEVVAMSQIRTNATGSTTSAVRIADGTNTVLIEEISDNSGEVPLGVNTSQPILVSYDNYLQLAYSPSGNADSIAMFATVIQVS